MSERLVDATSMCRACGRTIVQRPLAPLALGRWIWVHVYPGAEMCPLMPFAAPGGTVYEYVPVTDEPPPRARTIREPADYEQDLSEAEAIFPAPDHDERKQ